MDVEKLVDSEKNNMITLLGQLIKEDTTNPPGNEWRAANVVKKFFKKEKIKYKIFEKQKGRTNVVGYVGKGKPSMIIACHFDVVPAGSGWRSDPFKAKVKGGRVYGRGASDDKGPMASMLIAGKILKKLESGLKGQVILACVADEEKGSKYGMYYLLKEGKIKADYGIVPDIQKNVIDVAEKGLLHLKVTSIGRQAHGSRPHDGINAVWNMVEFLNLLKEYRMKFRKHSVLSDPTINLGSVRGGEAPNIVPGKCEALIDFRYLPSQKAEDITKAIKAMFRKVRSKNKKAKFSLEILDSQKPSEVEKDNVVVESIKRHSKKITGKYPKVTGLSGTTVVKPLVQKGVLAVGYAPEENVAHMANEYISMKEMTDFTKVLCLVCLDILG